MNDSMLLRVPARRNTYLIGVLVAAAWGILLAWQRSSYADLLGHEVLGDHHLSFSLKLSAFLLSWLLMTVAMMLPASLPILIHSARLTGQPGRDFRSFGGIILGYLLPWLGFGLLAYLGDGVLHELAETGGQWTGVTGWIAPSVALTAGLYQFTTIKWRCIQRCQPSHDMVTGMEKKRLANALREGAKLGLFCLGSCWSLMLLMFALGHHQLGWMLVMSVVFAGERLTPWGRQLSWLVGSILLLWVVFWLLR